MKDFYHKTFRVQLAEVGHKSYFTLGRNWKLIHKGYADYSSASLWAGPHQSYLLLAIQAVM